MLEVMRCRKAVEAVASEAGGGGGCGPTASRWRGKRPRVGGTFHIYSKEKPLHLLRSCLLRTCFGEENLNFCSYPSLYIFDL